MMTDDAVETNQMRTRLRLVVALAVLLAGCGATASPAPVASPARAPVSAPASTASPSAAPSVIVPAPTEPSTAPSPALSVQPIPTSFTTPVPPSADAPWTAIHWRRLASDDPLALVRVTLRWRGGFIAVGQDASGTPVWTSRDGAHWDTLPFDTATTFWPGLLVVDVAEAPAGLIALTVLGGPTGCGSTPTCQAQGATLPVMAWTSPDGRAWTPHTGPELGAPSTWRAFPRLAAGPTGLVAASVGSDGRMATSVDGIDWRAVPSGTLPAGIVIGDIAGTATGFSAVGSLRVDESHDRAVVLRSLDGRAWSGPYPLHLFSASGVILASTGPSWGAWALVAGRDGLVAVGGVVATPGAALWWQSTDGRTWRPLPGFPPLGPTSCSAPDAGPGCGGQPNGSLVGDGDRMVALRGGTDAAVWTSSDGVAWRRLPVSGDIPSEEALKVVLLPGGVLLSDGTATWFGEASAR